MDRAGVLFASILVGLGSAVLAVLALHNVLLGSSIGIGIGALTAVIVLRLGEDDER